MNSSNTHVENLSAESGGAQPEVDFLSLSPAQISSLKRQLAQYRTMLRKEASRSRPHVLIVEDQAFSRGLLREVLHQECSVSACGSAKDGWKIYLDEAPDIVFLDIGLPETNGHILADKIKELDPLSYVVMVTASQYIEDVERAKGNRVDGFIVKPFNKQKIDECIKRYLATHKAHAKSKKLS